MSNSVGSLKNCRLTTLSISSPESRVADQQEARDLALRKGAEGDAFTLFKKIVTKEMAQLYTIPASKARDTWYEYTLPMTLRGQRIVPISRLDELTKLMRQHEEKFAAGMEQFRQILPEVIRAARVRLTDCFTEADELRLLKAVSRGRLKFVDFPFPSLEDLGIDTSDPESLEANLRALEEYKSSFACGTYDLLTRVGKTLSQFVERMCEPDKRFKEVTVTGIRDLSELMLSMNITNDSRVEALRIEINDKLGKVTSSMMRADPAARDAAAIEAHKLTNKVSTIMTDLEDYF